MNHKPLLIVLGEPQSIFSEIIFKTFKKKILNNKRPIVFIGSRRLLVKQMKKLKYKIKINEIKINLINRQKLTNNYINLININYNFKKVFTKISASSKNYIAKCFKIALNILKKKQAIGLVNGPISKKYFLNRKFPGVTEYLKSKTNSKESVMLIYNKKISVSPITTHIPLSKVSKSLSIKKIFIKSIYLNNFYKLYLKKKPKIAVLGLNPHCESNEKNNEEIKIIIPAIKKLRKRKINISGPYSTDTFFLNKNIKKYDLIIGMYHDQVLTPIKTLFNFNAINITIGLPFVRISPDHGPNNEMIGKNLSDPNSLILALKFINEKVKF